MVAASLDEDRFGVAQRDIPKILEALVFFHSACTDYHSEIVKGYTLLTPEKVRDMSEAEHAEKIAANLEVERAGQVIAVLKNGECPRCIRMGVNGRLMLGINDRVE